MWCGFSKSILVGILNWGLDLNFCILLQTSISFSVVDFWFRRVMTIFGKWHGPCALLQTDSLWEILVIAKAKQSWIVHKSMKISGASHLMIMMMIQHWLPIVRLSSEASIKMDGDTSSTFILELVVTKDTKLCPKSTLKNIFKSWKFFNGFAQPFSTNVKENRLKKN